MRLRIYLCCKTIWNFCCRYTEYYNRLNRPRRAFQTVQLPLWRNYMLARTALRYQTKL